MKLFLSFLFALTCCSVRAQDVSPVAARAATIQNLTARLGKEIKPLSPEARNPFSMSGFEARVQEATVETKTQDPQEGIDLLSVLASQIDAKGRFVMGNEVMLLAGGNKRLKVGSKVPVTHGGLIYELEIAAIDTARFTVRYKNEEYTRPISQKPPAKNP